MPMKLNVGLNRKVGEPNYGSKGGSVNIEIELASETVNDPARLQGSIRQLFGLVRASLAEELNGSAGNGNGSPAVRGNGAAGTPSSPRPATVSQVRAIKAIASRQRLNLDTLLRERFQVAKPEDLTLKEASRLIDSLKEASP